MAFSISPPASIKAARQSLNPALVRSRNSFTSFAGISMAVFGVLILVSLSEVYLLLNMISLIAAHYLLCCKTARSKLPWNGPWFIPARRLLLGFFVVGRNSRFRRRSSFIGCGFDEGPFLLLILFVGAGIHVFHTIRQSLIRGGFMLADLRLFVSGFAFRARFGNF